MEVGEFVIIHHFDTPCTRLVAVITRIDGEVVSAEYITTGTKLKVCAARLKDVTPVSEFGVALKMSNGEVTGHQIADSTATYWDGSLRRWQPEHTETHKLRSKFIAAA